ncbi:unnamed protein product [Ilex paraguariensis]|uniref:Uncharacterized protein n=1 Tax=Ilex paraguariensis TaxID=185542 RepID=A0ABC8RIV8_9AQUA
MCYERREWMKMMKTRGRCLYTFMWLNEAKVELRDVDSGNKVNERLRTDEALERVFVEEKSFTYLYTDEETDSVVLME